MTVSVWVKMYSSSVAYPQLWQGCAVIVRRIFSDGELYYQWGSKCTVAVWQILSYGKDVQ